MEQQPIIDWPTMTFTHGAVLKLMSCYTQGQQIGSNTAAYIQLLIQHGKMEKRIIDGCVAILRLARIYGSERMEVGCKRALMGTRYNYKTIKIIIVNGLGGDDLINLDEEENNRQEHENLRGADFFDTNN